jgi:hypothetical protein
MPLPAPTPRPETKQSQPGYNALSFSPWHIHQPSNAQPTKHACNTVQHNAVHKFFCQKTSGLLGNAQRRHPCTQTGYHHSSATEGGPKHAQPGARCFDTCLTPHHDNAWHAMPSTCTTEPRSRIALASCCPKQHGHARNNPRKTSTITQAYTPPWGPRLGQHRHALPFVHTCGTHIQLTLGNRTQTAIHNNSQLPTVELPPDRSLVAVMPDRAQPV